jgi:NAD(P)-dependent dehydrogenase (short-subunit alcohol dehydrogenase family)
MTDLTHLTGFDGKVAVVTGAGRMRSIGRPIAVALAEAGCDVVLTGTGRAPERYPEHEQEVGWRDIDSVAEEISATGRRALPVVSDVSDLDAVRALGEQVMAAFGRVDVIVNNAAAARGDDRVPVVDLDPTIWRRVLDVGLTGAFYMSHVFGRLLVDQGRGGSFVNISSIGGKMLPANAAAYAATKAGLHALTSSMAKEVGQYGIRVNAICPGVVDTYRIDDMGRGEAWQNLIQTFIPLRRPGTGDDIAAITVFLCSDQGSWITGQSWNVDGGSMTAH